jgi:hypothetical protein
VLELEAHGANWQNWNTSRTPEGGPYLYQKVVCGKTCKIHEEDRTVLTYEPNHPDANMDGYVRRPQIDRKDEFQIISTYAHVLRQYSSTCPMQFKAVDKKDSALIQYEKGQVKMDYFRFRKNNLLASWMREDAEGRNSIMHF